MTFNPFKFIFTLEAFSKDSTLYDEVKLIRIINFIKDNKDKPDCIMLIDKEMKNIIASRGGSSVGPTPPTGPTPSALDQTLDTDIKTFIENAEKIINKVILKPDSDLLIVNLSNKIPAMAIIARDMDNEVKRTETMLDQLTKTMDYLITALGDYKTVLLASNLKTEENKKNADKLLELANEAKAKVDLTKESAKNPKTPIPEAPIQFVNESNDKTIEILKEMLTTKEIPLNIAAVKGILAASVAFSAIACLSAIKPNIPRSEHVTNGRILVTQILTKSIIAIYEKIGSSDSKTDSTAIDTKINETISFLKKMCTPDNMMEIFMEIIYLIEKPQAIAK